jgi:hypothetical protein
VTIALAAAARTAHGGGADKPPNRALLNNAIERAASGGLAWLFVVSVDAQTEEIEVYDATINAPGQFSLELHNNYTPIGEPNPISRAAPYRTTR